jgi:ribosomal-protein-serine acetyltransferase
MLTFALDERRRLRLLEEADAEQLSLWSTPTGSIVGVVGNHRIDWDDRWTSIGCWLVVSAQGNGTMTLAARALVDYVFSGSKLNRVEIRAGVENTRSRAVIERLGFTLEGVRRQAERLGDRYIDHAVSSMLAGEWAQRAAGSA